MRNDRIEDHDDDLDVGEFRERNHEDEIDAPPQDEIREFRMKKKPLRRIDESEKRPSQSIIRGNVSPRHLSEKRITRERWLLYGIFGFSVAIFILLIFFIINIYTWNQGFFITNLSHKSTDEGAQNRVVSLEEMTKNYGELNKRIDLMEKQINTFNKSLQYKSANSSNRT